MGPASLFMYSWALAARGSHHNPFDARPQPDARAGQFTPRDPRPRDTPVLVVPATEGGASSSTDGGGGAGAGQQSALRRIRTVEKGPVRYEPGDPPVVELTGCALGAVNLAAGVGAPEHWENSPA